MGLLLSRSNSHGENNSQQAAFYTTQVQKLDWINSDRLGSNKKIKIQQNWTRINAEQSKKLN